jgi:hypothetical protein
LFFLAGICAVTVALFVKLFVTILPMDVVKPSDDGALTYSAANAGGAGEKGGDDNDNNSSTTLQVRVIHIVVVFRLCRGV